MTKEPNLRVVFESAVKSILASVERPREAEVISRRFGIDGPCETLEQVGETMGITRERVRQIEKATMIRIKLSLEDGKNTDFLAIEMDLTRVLHENGRASRLDSLVERIMGNMDDRSVSVVRFLTELSGKMLALNENSKYYQSVILTNDKDDRNIKNQIDKLVEVLKKHGKPVTVDEFYKLAGNSYEHPSEVTALASLSKKIASLNSLWGLSRWPQVNPKNIRDKIYVVLKRFNHPMHFSEIAKMVKSDAFKRNNVTDQAIHNELIKDNRFVLIGRGIYALAEQGYKAGSIADVIEDLLSKNGAMYREEIVREVLKVRQVREATVLLNLQSKAAFKRVSKGKYDLAVKSETVASN